MVTDMYAQAQNAQTPEQPDELQGSSNALEMSKSFMGMPGGNSAEEIAQKVTMMLENAGLMGQSTKPEQLQQAIQEFAVAVEAKDIEAIKASPILALFDKYKDQLMPEAAPEAAPAQDPMAMAQSAGQGMPMPQGGMQGV